MDSMFNTLLARALAGGSGGGGGGTGTDDYTNLNNKPKVNNVTIVGNLTSSDLELQGEITSSHKLSADLVDDTNTTNKFNVQADWNQATNSAPDYIKNKPTLGTAAATDATAYATAAQGTKADSAIQTVEVNGTALTPTSAKAVNITVPTQASDINALPNTTKYAAALSLTIDSSTFVVTGQLKDQNGDNLGAAQTIDLPLESVVVGGSYDSQTKKVILTLQNGNTIEFSVADLVSGLQTELSASNKLNPAYINYDSTHRAVSDTEKSTWNGKQNALSFDGTYSASTNKAATVSTVTNAVNALDVTGDASVSASKTISAWSETDGKVSISTQDIAIAGTQTTLTGYAKSGTAGQAVAATDNVNQAIGKLEATVDDNKNNILLNTENGGGINKVDCSLSNLKSINSSSWTWDGNVATNGSQTITVNSDKTLTVHTTNSHGQISFQLTTISANQGDLFVSGCPSGGSTSTYRIGILNVGYDTGEGKIVPNQTTARTVFIEVSANVAIDLVFKPMVIDKSIHDSGFYGFQPYAMSNAELTAVKQNALSSAQLDAVNSGIDSTKVEQIETNRNNISFVKSQANWNTNNGVKNICPYNSGSTPSGEGTVWNNLPIDMAAGTYSLSFSTDSTNSALVLLAADGATEVLRKTYSATTVNDTFTISTAVKYIRLYIGSSKTVSNFMIHSFGDDTFVPYALSNAVITPALKECVDNGAKNLLKLGFSKKIAINQTAEMTADGNGVVINGSRNSVTDAILVYDIVTDLNDGLATRYTLPAGEYIMTKTGDANVRLQVYAHDGTNSIALGYTQVSDLHFEYTNEMKLQYPYLTFRIWVARVSNFDNFTFYPMICTKTAWDISQAYQPYRPSYQELYEMVKALQATQ